MLIFKGLTVSGALKTELWFLSLDGQDGAVKLLLKKQRGKMLWIWT